MANIRDCPRRRVSLVVAALLVGIAASGCDSSGVGRTVPVSGKVTVDDVPLTAKSTILLFKPDASKGNTSPFEPTGTVDENGNYGCANGNGVIWETNNPISILNVTDGSSNTFMIGEALTGKDYQNAWCHMDNAIATCAYAPNAKNPVTGKDYPANQWWNRYAFTSAHTNGVNFAMTDGSVQFISDSIALAVFRALGTRAVGEIAELP